MIGMAMENGRRRCAIYTRKSTDEGLEQSFNSLEAQREAAEAYVNSQRANGWELLPGHYDDPAFSGGNVNRPALKRLLADCAAGKVDVVVVYKVDRLSRSLCDFTDLSRQFDGWGVAFVSVTQQIDTSTSAGRMMLNLLMTFAEYEREIIGERIRDKFAASRRKGMWMGGNVPLGYRVEDRRLVVVPEEAETVRRIFRRYVEIQSPKAIANELNEEGLRTKTGREWNGKNMYHILSNCVYDGKISYKGEVHEGVQERIVDGKLWSRVQCFLGQNRTRSDGDRTVRAADIPMLKGLVRCGHCGGPVSPYWTLRKGRRYLYYMCVRDRSRPVHACPLRQVPGNALEEAVLRRLTAIFRTPELAMELSRMSGMAPQDVMGMLDGPFWEGMTAVERGRVVELLVAGITVWPDRMDIEIRTGGLAGIMEELENDTAED